MYAPEPGRGQVPRTENRDADEYSHSHHHTTRQDSPRMDCFSSQSVDEVFWEQLHGATQYNQLPSYIEPIPSHITGDDLQFLSYKHALLIPDSKAEQERWRAYWIYAHPCMPVLDQIRMSKSRRGCGEKISMLLYQCVMLVGQVFLNAYETPRYEFTDTQELFERVRALYELGWETRPLIILQSLLLMTLFPQKVSEPKGQAYLVGHAVSMAYRIGLHRNPTNLKIKAPFCHLRKLLWWSLFVRERTLIFDQGGPWIIDDTDHDVPMITTDDFCLTQVSPDVGTHGPLVSLNGISRRRKIAITWVEKAKLAVIMGRISPITVRIPESNSSFSENPWLQSGVPRGYQLSNDVVVSLERWRKNIAPEIDFARLNSTTWWVGDHQLYIHYTALRLLYHTVKFQLAVSRVLSTEQTGRETICQEVGANCDTIMHITEELQLHGHAALVPLYGTSVLRPVLIWAILNGISSKDTPQGSSSDPLQFDIGKVDSHRCLFKAFLLCEEERAFAHDIK